MALGVVLWVVTAIFYGGAFSEALILANTTPEAFLGHLRIVLGVAAFAGVFNCIYWFYYGSLEEVAGKLGEAKRFWRVSFILQIILSVALLFILVLMNLSEGVHTSFWLIIFGLLSLHTWFFFWLCTYFMSPRPVKNIPLFR